MDIFWESSKEKKNSSQKSNTNIDDSSDDDNNVVEVSNNRIYFYSSVNRAKVLKLNRAIHNLGISLTHRALHLDMDPPSIKLHINSYGGSVFAGFAAVDYIMNSKVPVDTIIDGCAASAATIISVVGERRFMHRNSFMLIHQLSSGMWGNFKQLQDDMKNCELLMKKIKQIYKQHTKIPKKKLDELLEHDLWWDSETCLEYGLIDEVI